MAISVVRGVELTSLSEAEKRKASHLASKMWYKPSWEELIYNRIRKWWMTFLLGKIGGTESNLENVYFWNEEGKYFGKKTTHATEAVTEPTAGELKIPLNEDAYFVVTDIVDLGIEKPGEAGQNVHAQVIEVGVTGGGNQYILTKFLEVGLVGAIEAIDIPVNHEISLTSNAQGECFEIPKGRMFLPDKYENYLQKISHTYKICDEATRKRLYFKTGSGELSFLDYDDQITQEEHKRIVDSTVLFGQKSLSVNSDGNEQYTTEGIISSLVKYSMIYNKSGTYAEEDMQDIMTVHSTYAKGNEFDYFAGQNHCVEIQRAMKPYLMSGSYSFGSFTQSKMQSLGINVTRYQFGNVVMNLWNYKGFDDPDFLPANNTAVNYKNLGMILYLRDGGIKVVYQLQRSGKALKNWFDEYRGPTMAADHRPTSRNACIERAWTTSVGTKIKGMNNHALVLDA